MSITPPPTWIRETIKAQSSPDVVCDIKKLVGVSANNSWCTQEGIQFRDVPSDCGFWALSSLWITQQLQHNQTKVGTIDLGFWPCQNKADDFQLQQQIYKVRTLWWYQGIGVANNWNQIIFPQLNKRQKALVIKPGWNSLRVFVATRMAYASDWKAVAYLPKGLLGTRMPLSSLNSLPVLRSQVAVHPEICSSVQ